MLSRVYLLMIAVFALVLAAMSFYAYSWLGSIGDPQIVSDAYLSHTSYSWTFLWLSFVILAGTSLFMTWKTGTRWAVPLAMAYFVAFSLLIVFNDSSYKVFLSDNSMTASQTLLNPFFAAVMFLVVALALAAAYVVTTNLRVRFKKVKDPPDSESTE